MDEILAILKKLHADVDFANRADLVDAGVLDSFDIISLVAEVDHVFDVRIPAEEIVPENFNSAEALYAMIQRLADE
jgi:D-alanine--poly(phosphoribitol) ligase subunit 2